MTLIYRVKTATREEFQAHLKECDRNFKPPLSSRVDLLNYSRKIFDESVSFEAWDDNLLVGMINAYFNDTGNRIGYITNVSILKQYMGKGIASRLLEMCSKHARRHNFIKLRLEVSRHNVPAKKLYALSGFKTIIESGDSLLMEHEMPGTRTD